MKQLRNNIPLISAFIFIISGINLSVYYKFFGISIMPYLDLTEVVQLQFEVFTWAIGLLIAQFIYSVISAKILDSKDLNPIRNSALFKLAVEMISITSITRKQTEPSKFEQFLDNHRFISSITGFIVLVIMFKINYVLAEIAAIISIPIAIWIISIVYREFCVEINERIPDTEVSTEQTNLTTEYKLKSNEKKKRSITDTAKIVAILTTTTYISIVFTLLHAKAVISNDSETEAVVYFLNGTLATNNNFRYIGRTKNFIYFYSISDSRAEIYPTTNVTKLLIGKGKHYN